MSRHKKDSKKKKKDEFFVLCPRCQDGFLILTTSTYKSTSTYFLFNGEDKAYLDDAGETEKDVQHTLGCNECPYSRDINVSIDKLLPTIAKWAKERIKPQLDPSNSALSLTERPRDNVGKSTEKV